MKPSRHLWTVAAPAAGAVLSRIAFLFLLSASCLLLAAPSAHADTTSGLVGWWTLNGKDTNWNTNTTNDVSGNGNTGTLVSMSTTTSPVLGKLGQALNFNGTSQYVNIPSPAGSVLDATSTFSVAAWVKVHSHVANDRIVEKYWASSYELGINNSGSGDGFAFDVGYGTIATNHNGIPIDQWVHVVGTYDGLNIDLYENGVLTGTATTTPQTGSGAAVTIGSTAGGGNYFNGQIDDVRIYSRALSASDVMQLYKQGQAKGAASPVNSLTNGLIGYWTMDGKTTTWTGPYTGTTADASGNGNTGTLTNMGMATSTVAGKLGQALNFNSVNQYIDLNNPSAYDLTAGGKMTISTWVNTGPYIINGTLGIVRRGNTYTPNSGDQYSLIN